MASIDSKPAVSKEPLPVTPAPSHPVAPVASPAKSSTQAKPNKPIATPSATAAKPKQPTTSNTSKNLASNRLKQLLGESSAGVSAKKQKKKSALQEFLSSL